MPLIQNSLRKMKGEPANLENSDYNGCSGGSYAICWDWNQARHDGLAVASVGSYANHLHLAPPITMPHLITQFLANVNSSSRSLYAIARPSVVCNVRAPYSGGSHFWQYFYGIRYPGHPLTSTENFTEIVLGEPFRRGS